MIKAPRHQTPVKLPPRSNTFPRLSVCATEVVSILGCGVAGATNMQMATAFALAVLLGHLYVYNYGAPRPRSAKIISGTGTTIGLGILVYGLMHLGHLSNISAEQGALATLLAALLGVHSFISGTRRDLGFAIGLSAGLLAVAASQAASSAFLAIGAIWFIWFMVACLAIWRSHATSLPGMVPAPAAIGVVGGILVVTVAVFAILPPAGAGGAQVFPASVSASGTNSTQGVNSSLNPYPAHAVTGAVAATSYLSISAALNTSARGGGSGNAIVATVRSPRPSYWEGQSFDTWNGTTWTQSNARQIQHLNNVPVVVPTTASSLATAGGPTMVQTFYLHQNMNMVLGTYPKNLVYMPGVSIYESGGNALHTEQVLNKGTIYTTVSDPRIFSTAQLDALGSALSPTAGLTTAQSKLLLQTPHAYRRLSALAHQLTAGDTSTWAKTTAISNWLAAHTHYTLNAPVPPRGVDAVNYFVFDSHLGFCEQISTAATIMLRLLGIPARETVGYVTGGRSAFSGLWTIREKDAHAWVQVWIPGAGWQSYDPTASVPLAGDYHPISNLQVMARFVSAAVHTAQFQWAAGTLGGLMCIGAVLWVWRRYPTVTSWRLAWIGARYGRRKDNETLRGWIDRLSHSNRPLPASVATSLGQIEKRLYRSQEQV